MSGDSSVIKFKQGLGGELSAQTGYLSSGVGLDLPTLRLCAEGRFGDHVWLLSPLEVAFYHVHSSHHASLVQYGPQYRSTAAVASQEDKRHAVLAPLVMGQQKQNLEQVQSLEGHGLNNYYRLVEFMGETFPSQLESGLVRGRMYLQNQQQKQMQKQDQREQHLDHHQQQQQIKDDTYDCNSDVTFRSLQLTIVCKTLQRSLYWLIERVREAAAMDADDAPLMMNGRTHFGNESVGIWTKDVDSDWTSIVDAFVVMCEKVLIDEEKKIEVTYKAHISPTTSKDEDKDFGKDAVSKSQSETSDLSTSISGAMLSWLLKRYLHRALCDAASRQPQKQDIRMSGKDDAFSFSFSFDSFSVLQIPTPYTEPSLLLVFIIAVCNFLTDIQVCTQRVDRVLVRGLEFFEKEDISTRLISAAMGPIQDFMTRVWSRFLYKGTEPVACLCDKKLSLSNPSKSTVRCSELVLLALDSAIKMTPDPSLTFKNISMSEQQSLIAGTPLRDASWQAVTTAVDVVIAVIWAELLSPDTRQNKSALFQSRQIATLLCTSLLKATSSTKQTLQPNVQAWVDSINNSITNKVWTVEVENENYTNITQKSKFIVYPIARVSYLNELLGRFQKQLPQQMSSWVKTKQLQLQNAFERFKSSIFPNYIQQGLVHPGLALAAFPEDIELFAKGWAAHTSRIALAGLLDAGPEGAEEAMGAGAALIGGGPWGRIRVLPLALHKRVILPSPSLAYCIHAIREAVKLGVTISPILSSKVLPSDLSQAELFLTAPSLLAGAISASTIANIIAEARDQSAALAVSRHNNVYQRCDLAFLAQICTFGLGFCARIALASMHVDDSNPDTLISLKLPWIASTLVHRSLKAEAVDIVTEPAAFIFFRSYVKLIREYLRIITALVLLHAPSQSVARILKAVHSAERTRLIASFRRRKAKSGDSRGADLGNLRDILTDVQSLRYGDSVIRAVAKLSEKTANDTAYPQIQATHPLSASLRVFMPHWEGGEVGSPQSSELGLGCLLGCTISTKQHGSISVDQDTPSPTFDANYQQAIAVSRIFPNAQLIPTGVPAVPQNNEQALLSSSRRESRSISDLVGFISPQSNDYGSLAEAARLLLQMLKVPSELYGSSFSSVKVINESQSSWALRIQNEINKYHNEGELSVSTASLSDPLEIPYNLKTGRYTFPTSQYFSSQFLRIHDYRQQYQKEIDHLNQVRSQQVREGISRVNSSSVPKEVESGQFYDPDVRIQLKKDAAPEDETLAALADCLLLTEHKMQGGSSTECSDLSEKAGRALLDHVGSFTWFLTLVSSRHDIRSSATDANPKSVIDKPPLTNELSKEAHKLSSIIESMLMDLEAFWKECNQKGHISEAVDHSLVPERSALTILDEYSGSENEELEEKTGQKNKNDTSENGPLDAGLSCFI